MSPYNFIDLDINLCIFLTVSRSGLYGRRCQNMHNKEEKYC